MFEVVEHAEPVYILHNYCNDAFELRQKRLLYRKCKTI